MNAARHASPAMARRWWIPTTFVLVVLVLLLCMPLAVGYRVRQLRQNRADVVDDARVRVNDLEAAFATELLTMTASRDSLGAPDSVATSAFGVEREDELALDSLMGRLGSGSVERLFALRSAEQRWRRRNAEQRVAGIARAADRNVQGGRDVLAAAEDLDRYLYAISLGTRNRVRNLEMVDELSAIVLAPVALIALAIVFSLGRRMILVAQEAEDERNALQRSVELRATLIHGVTHDIKNPLGAASGYASLLEDEIAGPLTPQQREMLGRVQRLVRIAQETIAELLELARADAGELHVARVSTDLSQILRDLVADYQLAAEQKKIQLSKDDAAAPTPVMTDPLRARQVAENLLSNAIKYTPPGGTVRVGIVNADGQTPPAHRRGIAVRDNGPGVPANLRDRIFDEFFRVPATAGSTSGTGLGLAVSRRMARLLGGDVTVDDAPGGGSMFTFWLPGDDAN